jgi:hypothetical protein
VPHRIFTLDEPLEIARHPDPRQPGGKYDTAVGGLHSSPALIVHDGAQSGIQLELSPLAARPLLGLPAGELAHADVHADELLGRLAIELHERVRAAPGWHSRFAVLDEVLGAALDGEQAAPPEIQQAWAMLRTPTASHATAKRPASRMRLLTSS